MTLDLLELSRAENAQDYLRKALPLPEWYGGNLDALYDCACAWHDIELTISHTNTAGYAQQVLNVLCDAAAENPHLTLIEID